MKKITTAKDVLTKIFLIIGFLTIVIGGDWLTKTSASKVNQQTLTPTQERIKDITGSPVFTEFDAFVNQYADENFTASNEQSQVGENLAIKRKQLLKKLIALNPQAALEKTIPAKTFNRVPRFIKEHSEIQVSAYGDFLVYVLDKLDPSTGEMRESRTERKVIIGDVTYEAVVFGRREEMPTKLNIPLQGIAIDNIMIVDESPVRKLDSTELAERNIDNSILSANEVTAEIGGKIVNLSSQSELDNFVREQIEWESKIGPVRTSKSLSADKLASSWTEGVKKVLYIRVDFPDRQGEPSDNQGALTQTRVQNLMDTQVSPFYVNNSYNKTSLQTTVTPVVRMPQPQTFYTHNNLDDILNDARTAARASGFETNNFDLDIIAFSSQNFGSTLATVGSKGVMINGSFDSFSFYVTTHELGHNYGLVHANFWKTTDGTVIGSGSNIEYGDIFDLMGGEFTSIGHFNAYFKRYLNWLNDANVQTITNNGVYRIFAQDSSAAGGIRVLRIRKDGTKNYWVEFRQLLTNNPNIMNGATVRWESTINSTQLLDMTPNTTSRQDAPLLIGQSFLDDVSRVKITILGKGNTTPESLDVKVELNVGCTFSLVGQTNQNFPPSGGEGEITFNTQSSCRQPTMDNSDWLYAFPTDTGSVRYIVAANYDSQPRTGIITINGQDFTVQQSASVTSCVQPPPNLVAWWRGEGNALDQTGVNNGTLVNEMSFGGGKIGGGFYGNNNQKYTAVPDSASLSLTQSMTFEGWLKMDSYGGTVIERKRADFPSGGSYRVDVSPDGRLGFTINYSNNSGNGIITPANALPLGQFAHFAATRDDATGKRTIYINGNLISQHTFTQLPNVISGAITKVGNINGITDELSVYNRALSALEIQAIYNAGTAATGSTGKCLSTVNNISRPKFDFDGDGKTDISIFRPSLGEWWYQKSSNGGNGAVQFGSSTDKIVPGDYTGDGKTDMAFFRPISGEWFVLRSEDSSFYSFPFGTSEDIPAPADYDADGKADPAVFRPSTNTWFISKSTGGTTIQTFGQTGDIPVVADYDGDSRADIAIYRPSKGEWWINRSSAGTIAFQFGNSTDKPVQADYTGDGKADIAFFRPSSGEWFILRSENSSYYSFPFGTTGDVPSPGDYDGDGRTDATVFRLSNNTWFVQRTSLGTMIQTFGQTGDKPIPSAFVP